MDESERMKDSNSYVLHRCFPSAVGPSRQRAFASNDGAFGCEKNTQGDGWIK